MEKYLKHAAYREDFLKFEEKHPGFFEFLETLQVGNRIKFKNLRFGMKPYTDWVIEIVFREEVGERKKTNGIGCIEYANIEDKTGEFLALHNNGYFPCQTFMSMEDWFTHSDSYELLNKKI